MNDLEGRKNRFMQDTLAIRIGGLAANLARVSSFSKFDSAKKAVSGLIEESQYFIEWTATEYDLSMTVELVGIQRLLAKWNSTIDLIWNDTDKRGEISDRAKEISNQLLLKTGLLNQ